MKIHKIYDLLSLHLNKMIFVGFLIMISVIFILSNNTLTLNVDEPFSMGIVQHSFSHIIYLDSLDVHPPLYYLVLKLFLTITTFWTKSMLVQIIFARLFSVVIFLCIIKLSLIILRRCSVNINYKIQGALLCMLPILLNRFSNIRMYGLSTLFLLLEIYSIVKFDIEGKYWYLFFSSLFVTLNFYTFYIGGMSSLLYLFIFLINKVLHEENLFIKKSIFFIISPFLLFLPWLFVVFQQYIFHINNDNDVQIGLIHNIYMSITQSSGKVGVLLLLLFEILFIIYMIKHRYENLLFYRLISCILIDLLITIMITFIICHNNFQPNSIYPICTVSVILLSTIPICILHKRFSSVFVGCAIIFLLLSIFMDIKGISVNISQFHLQRVQVSQVYKWRESKCKEINVYPHNYIGLSGKQFNAAQDSLYLLPMRKKAVVHGESYEYLSKGILNDKKNSRLIKKLFSNMYVKY